MSVRFKVGRLPPYVCEHCEEELIYAAQLERHEARHVERGEAVARREEVVCEVCFQVRSVAGTCACD